MTEPNETMTPLAEAAEEDQALMMHPPKWANATKVLGDSTDSATSKTPMSEASTLDEDVFEDGMAERALVLHDPPPVRPRAKRVRVSSGPVMQNIMRTRNPSGTPMVAPPWANASFDLGDSPQRLKPYKRQQSCPVMFDRPDAGALHPPRFDRQKSAPSSPTDKPFYRDPPARRRRYRSGRMSSTKSIDLSWANTSVDLGEEPELPKEPTITDTLIVQKPDEVSRTWLNYSFYIVCQLNCPILRKIQHGIAKPRFQRVARIDSLPTLRVGDTETQMS